MANSAAMRQLLLLRHAKSSWDDPALSDHARPLNARGRKSAAAMAQVMRDLGLVPDIVLVSSARRTLQTLEALTPFEAGALVEPMDALYLAPWGQLLETIQAVPETARSLLVIGHNPGLHDLALALAGPAWLARGTAEAQRLAAGYPTGSLAEFTIATPWRMVEAGGGRLVRFVVPRDLSAADLTELPA
jgi:phosphohistidine phosphatase